MILELFFFFFLTGYDCNGVYLEALQNSNFKIGLRHVLSWPKLSLAPKFHDAGTFLLFFTLDRLGAPKKTKQKQTFFYKGDPPKKLEFFKKNYLHLLIFKIFILSKFHSPMCRNGRNFTKKKIKK